MGTAPLWADAGYENRVAEPDERNAGDERSKPLPVLPQLKIDDLFPRFEPAQP